MTAIHSAYMNTVVNALKRIDMFHLKPKKTKGIRISHDLLKDKGWKRLPRKLKKKIKKSFRFTTPEIDKLNDMLDKLMEGFKGLTYKGVKTK